jgi:hypothetical protein
MPDVRVADINASAHSQFTAATSTSKPAKISVQREDLAI